MVYGYDNFHLEVLEYCYIYEVIKLEQYYIDKFKLVYNILIKARSSLDFKHSKQTLDKFKIS